MQAQFELATNLIAIKRRADAMGTDHFREPYLDARNEAEDPVLYRPGRCKACLRGQRRRASARDARHVAYPSRGSLAELGLAALAGGLFY